MKTIHFTFTPTFKINDFFYYCYYFNVAFSFNGYETLTVTVNEEYEKEILERIRTNNFEF
jgi:hypothetical protein